MDGNAIACAALAIRALQRAVKIEKLSYLGRSLIDFDDI